jgi:excinuclease ABC subunit C
MFDIQEELKRLPDKPGVYIMKDENNTIIYIGKAVVLKNRVRQYFQASSRHSPKVVAMVSKIKEFEYIVTDSELEALILECNLIKKHKPKFNILLKDDKHYPYIKVTMGDDYPRVLMTRRIEKDGAKYFGPYSNSFAVKETIDVIKKLFPIKTCHKVFPRDIGKDRPCLNFYIHQCLGPCRGNIDMEEYRSMMKDICSFLGGKQEEIIQKLESQMQQAAEGMEFEKAARIRDKINSIKHIAEKQKVLSTAMEDQDVVAYAKGATDSCIQVFFIRGGKMIGKEHFIFEGQGDATDGELMTSFLKQFYSSAAYVPPEIVLQDGNVRQEAFDELNIIEHWLTQKKAARVHIKIPQKGEKRHLVDMVAQNATIALNQFKERMKDQEGAKSEGLKKLTGLLGLEEIPKRIEAYDISNTGSSEMVASMVVFEDGEAANREYRRFKIKTLEVQNDYASMQEVIYRRFKHAQKEMEEDPNTDGKFTKLPDLLLIDGGLGHLNAVKSVLQELGVQIPVFGMVKNERHQTRGLVSNVQEYNLTGDLAVLRFVTSIQDEAHRFAIEYNRKLRQKRHTTSALDDVEGVGPKKKKALIKHFGSVRAIKNAEIDDLTAVEGVTTALAERIYDYFHS